MWRAKARLEAQLDPDHDASRTRDWYRPCPVCDGEHGHPCEICHGLGHVEDDEEPAGLADVAGVLEARFAISVHGIDGWLRSISVDGIRPDVDPLLLEALRVFEAEYAQLEHEAQVRRVERSRQQQKRQRRR